MRIISGEFRGLQLKLPPGLPVRPTTDFAKTGLFNILNNRYEFVDSDVLDLFAGTGNLSFEFISRNVNSCISVDKDPGCIKFMKATQQKICPRAPMQIVQADVIKYLTNCLNRFDIILADPPYLVTPGEELLELVFNRNLLNEKGVFILEHAKDRNFETHDKFMESRKYGTVNFSFFGETN